MLVLSVACTAALVIGQLTFSGDLDAVPVDYRTVHAGETLWAIAGEVAPGADPRDTAAVIRNLNDMKDSTVRIGQLLLVPRR